MIITQSTIAGPNRDQKFTAIFASVFEMAVKGTQLAISNRVTLIAESEICGVTGSPPAMQQGGVAAQYFTAATEGHTPTTANYL
jgi:hypothetical protein